MPARLVFAAYGFSAAIGAAAGFVILLVGALPSGFAIWFAAGGLVVGAFIGMLTLTAGIVTLDLSRPLKNQVAVRHLLVVR